MALKHLKLPKNHLKQSIFFQILVGDGPFSATILVGWKTKTSKLSGGAILHLSDYPYHTNLNGKLHFF